MFFKICKGRIRDVKDFFFLNGFSILFCKVKLSTNILKCKVSIFFSVYSYVIVYCLIWDNLI